MILSLLDLSAQMATSTDQISEDFLVGYWWEWIRLRKTRQAKHPMPPPPHTKEEWSEIKFRKTAEAAPKELQLDLKSQQAAEHTTKK